MVNFYERFEIQKVTLKSRLLKNFSWWVCIICMYVYKYVVLIMDRKITLISILLRIPCSWIYVIFIQSNIR